MLAKFIKFLFWTFLVLSILLISLLKIIDETPYQDKAYYKEWKKCIKTATFEASTGDSTLKVGFSKVSITPPYPTPMAGYGNRRGEKFKKIADSIFVRTIVLTKGKAFKAIISADLLIIPPTIYELVLKKSKLIGFNENDLFFGATHSHNSVGGWYNTLVGKLFAGTYDPKIEEIISDAIVTSLINAKKNLEETEISYEVDSDLVDIYNRLVEEKGTIDPFIRSLVFNRKGTKPLILTTYAAHATILNSNTMELSRDYAGQVVDALEKNNYEFAIFMAGAVGSMGPVRRGKTNFDELKNQGKSVTKEIISENEYEDKQDKTIVKQLKLKLPLREASPRITQKLALRSWVFNNLFGKSEIFVNALLINNNLIIGLPCDFSGELTKPLSLYAKSKNLNLIITSFNGGYIGYITKDTHFKTDTYETITMNWYGPYNGAYFSEIITDIIDKVAE